MPHGYVAEPRVHLGPFFEIDETAFANADIQAAPAAAGDGGGLATIAWTATPPPLEVEADWPDQYEYEVLVFDLERERQLVAAVELVSPANKDRPESRRAFVTKCAALLQQGVAIAIVDLVTTRQFNLYAELLEWIGKPDLALGAKPPRFMRLQCASRSRRAEPFCNPGRIPWSWDNRCRPCRCGYRPV